MLFFLPKGVYNLCIKMHHCVYNYFGRNYEKITYCSSSDSNDSWKCCSY